MSWTAFKMTDDSFKLIDFQLISIAVDINKGVILFPDLLLDLIETDLAHDLLLVTG